MLISARIQLSGGALTQYTLNSRPQLFERQITLSTGQITIQWLGVNKTNHAIHWIGIYAVDCVIRHSNPGLVLPLEFVCNE